MYFRDCSDTIRETSIIEAHLRVEVTADFKTFEEEEILVENPYSSEEAMPAVLLPHPAHTSARGVMQQQLELPQHHHGSQLLVVLQAKKKS